MGGRGSSFKPENNSIEDKFQKRKKPKYYLDLGNIKDDKIISQQNKLTKELKESNILVYETTQNLDKDLAQSSLQQIKKLADNYNGIVSSYLDTEDLKIRSYKINRVSIKTHKSSPDYEVRACFAPLTSQICLNERTIRTNEKLIEEYNRQQKTNYSVTVDKGQEKNHVITHEFGHFVENCIIENRLKQDVKTYNTYKTDNKQRLEIEWQEASKIVKEVTDIATQKYKAKEKDLVLSDYGTRDPFEWFAETFTETSLHTTNKPLVQAMREFLSKENKQ